MINGYKKIDGKDYNFNEDGNINNKWDKIIGENRFDKDKKIS